MKRNIKKILVATTCLALITAASCSNSTMSETKKRSDTTDADTSSSEIVSNSETTTSHGENGSSYSLEEQISAMIASRSTWQTTDEGSNGWDKFAITDLDQDGYYEIISITTGGSGLFTYTNIYEVNATCSGVDLVASINPIDGIEIDWFQTTINYRLTGNNTYAYQISNSWRSGWESNGEVATVLSANESTFDTAVLGYATYTYNDQGELESSLYCDSDNNELTEEDYNNLFFTALPGDLDEFGTLTIEYTTELEMGGYSNISDEELEEMLLEAASNTYYCVG